MAVVSAFARPGDAMPGDAMSGHATPGYAPAGHALECVVPFPEETIMLRKASARWTGSTKEGSGTLSTQSGTLRDMPTRDQAPRAPC